MPRQTTRSRVLGLLCASLAVALLGTTTAVAAELPARDGGSTDGGTTTDCAALEAAAYDAIDAVVASHPIDSLADEVSVLHQVQAIVTELDHDLSNAHCAADGPPG